MATIIKAWIATASGEPDTRLHTQIIACNGGEHFHLFAFKEFRYDTLTEADRALTECMMAASIQHGVLQWDDETNAYDDIIIRGEN